ncbi:hypothetical protein CLV48_108145 [Cecembia rubra]|uniref:Uncharacterized protein n=1 Tax=Cecembia rubra TaxID=1485585 RepID=A0A2P8E0M9_9BACT|nr:hypothetical protein CLV48_108145 [Cecembia rubra]
MKILSSARICRIKAQGYDKGFNNEEIPNTQWVIGLLIKCAQYYF